jgi:hypothetical protein
MVFSALFRSFGSANFAQVVKLDPSQTTTYYSVLRTVVGCWTYHPHFDRPNKLINRDATRHHDLSVSIELIHVLKYLPFRSFVTGNQCCFGTYCFGHIQVSATDRPKVLVK